MNGYISYRPLCSLVYDLSTIWPKPLTFCIFQIKKIAEINGSGTLLNFRLDFVSETEQDTLEHILQFLTKKALMIMCLFKTFRL